MIEYKSPAAHLCVQSVTPHPSLGQKATLLSLPTQATESSHTTWSV